MPVQIVSLQLPAQLPFMPVAMAFAESCAAALTMEPKGAAALQLAVEEVFATAASTQSHNLPLELTCRGNGYYVEMLVALEPHILPPDAFSLVRPVSADDAHEDESMGLFMAGRAVDKLFMDMLPDGRLELRFVIFRQFEAVNLNEELPLLPSQMGGVLNPSYGDEEGVRALSLQAFARYGMSIPLFMRAPDMLWHMIRTGHYQAVLLRNEKGHVAGGMVYSCHKPLARMHGPFIFIPQEGLGERLTQLAFSAMEGEEERPACALSRCPTVETPVELFTDMGLGMLCRNLWPDNTKPASDIYVPAPWRDFVGTRFTALDLTRHVRVLEPAQNPVQDPVQSPAEESELRTWEQGALAVELDKEKKEAWLRWLWCGQDSGENLQKHKQLLHTQGYETLYFTLELSSAMQMSSWKYLAEAGFVPCALLPLGGELGDTLILIQQDKDEKPSHNSPRGEL